MDAEAAAPGGDVDQRADEAGELPGQGGELVDDDDQAGQPSPAAAEVVDVGGAPGPQLPLPVAQLRLQAEQRPLRRLAVEVGHHADRVRQPGGGVEGAATLVVDEDEGEPSGIVVERQ